MTNFDSLDYELKYLSTKDNRNFNNYLDESLDSLENINNNDIGTESNNKIFEPNNSEIFNQSILEEDNINDNKNLFLFVSENNHLVIESQKQKLGRKSKDSNEKGKHTKEQKDNMVRKLKVIFKNSLMKFINSMMLKIFRKDKVMIMGKEYTIQILNIKQDKVKDTGVEFNKNLLNEQIKDFFNDTISGNYTNYPKNFNGLLIDKLYEIENGEKITCILEMTFLDCLKYFRMDEDVYNDPDYSCLKGLEKYFLELRKELSAKYNETYIDSLIQLFKDFEKIYRDKKPRAPRIKKAVI